MGTDTVVTRLAKFCCGLRAAVRSIERAAMSLQVPIVVGCQLNRRVEHRKEKVPILSDLKDSGDIEAGAQFVFGLYRPGNDDKSLPDDRRLKTVHANTHPRA